MFRHQLRKDAVSLNFLLTFSLSNAFLVFKRNVFSLHLVPCNLPWNWGGGGGEGVSKEREFLCPNILSVSPKSEQRFLREGLQV